MTYFFMVATSVANDIVLIVMSEQKGWQHFRITFPRTACGLRFLSRHDPASVAFVLRVVNSRKRPDSHVLVSLDTNIITSSA